MSVVEAQAKNSSNHNALIVDDDARILKLLKQFFENHKYNVFTAQDGQDAIFILANNTIDVIILDVMIPGLNGIELMSQIKLTQNIPVILLTALSSINDKIHGFEKGADDYLTKPCDPQELMARTQRLIELYKKHKSSVVHLGMITYNTITKELKKNNDIIILSSTERKLLDTLIAQKNTVLTRDSICKSMHGINSRSIDVQIKRLRDKIEPDPKRPVFLKTERHLGYVLYVA